MFRVHSRLAAALVSIFSLTICTTAEAYDAWPTDLQWIYPQTLTKYSEFKFRWHFQRSPAGYPSSSQYTVRLYLSTNIWFDSSGDRLLASLPLTIPAGFDDGTITVTATPSSSGLSLPSSGTYYVFLEQNPGVGAPPDSNLSNNVTMDPNPIQVEGEEPPPPPPPPTGALTAATVVTGAHTGQSMVVAGYNNGRLRFCNWQGDTLAERDGLGNVTALHADILGSPPLPRVFVASAGSGGTLRIVDAGDINRDIVSRFSVGTIKAIGVCHEGEETVCIGTLESGGTLHKLNSVTLADEQVRSNMGEISEIAQIHSAWGDRLVVGSDKSGGSVYFLNKSTLANAVTPRQNLGTIYGLSSADVDLDGEAELVIASSKNGGSVRLTEGPSFTSDLAVRNQLGDMRALDYGRMQPEPFISPTNDAWVLIASASNSSSVRILKVNIGPSTVSFDDWATRNMAGTVYYGQLHDYYTVGIPLVGVVLADSGGLALHVLDTSLTQPAAPLTEDFETGNFSKFPWQRSGNANWTITSGQKHSGTFSAKAGSISHDESTTLQVTLDCVSGNISFWRKVSSEPGFDRLRFYIGGSEKGSWSGAVDWAEVSFPVTAGSRTFKWVYSKDGSSSVGSDTAWIDDIEFPTAPSPEAVNGETQSQQADSAEPSEQDVLRIVTVVEYE